MNHKNHWIFSSLVALSLLNGCAAQESSATLAATVQTVVPAVQQTIGTELSDAVALVTDIRTTQYYTDTPVSEADLDTILLAGINAPSAMNGQPWHFSVVTDDAVLEEIEGGMRFGQKPPTAQGEQSEALAPPEMPNGDKTVPPEDLPEEMEKPDASDNADMPFEPNSFPGGEQPMTPPASSGTEKAGLTDVPLAIVISCKEGSELDAGLACQNMSVTAQLLGYGTKIVTSPTIALNGDRQDDFRIILGIPEGQEAVAVLLIGEEDTSVDTTADAYTGATERNRAEDLVSYVTP